MSLNGSDAKKRKVLNTEEALLESSTKKIKVQAQRKFAQNAVTPTSTPQKQPIQTPVVPSNATKPPIKRPNTEDFLTFLCFRGTSLLPPRLDFFNKPQRALSAQEIAVGKKRRKSTPVLPVTNNVNNGPNERKNVRQLPQTKFSLTKLGQKVIGRNLVRSSSRYTIRQEALTLRQFSLRHGSKIKKPKPKVKKPPVEEVKKKVKKNGKQVSLDGKQVQKIKGRITRSNSLPSIFCPPLLSQLRDDKGKWCKGSSKSSSKTSDDSKDVEERPSRNKTASKNLDHRSNSLGSMKRKTSDIKCKVTNKNDRKTRSLISKQKNDHQDNYVAPYKKCDKNLKTVSKINKANSLIETKLTVDVKRRTSSVDNMKTDSENKDNVSSTRSRPHRRTKEAATIFMEMLRKDMRCPDEQEDDDTSSVESFPELPNSRINEQRERELKVLSKNSKARKQSDQFSENKDAKTPSSSLSTPLSSSFDKKTVVKKKAVKDKRKSDSKTLPVKKKATNKEVPPVKVTSLLVKKKVKEDDISFEKGTKVSAKKKFKEEMPLEKVSTSSAKKKSKEEEAPFEKVESTSFKRNLRPRRSSTMLDDYIMTDSEEDYEQCILEAISKYEAPKLLPVAPSKKIADDSKKNKNNVEESGKKNVKNKTDLKPKKDLNKVDSEVKNSLSETKSKNILKRDKEPEIKNKNTVVDKKSSKNKTETVISKETKTAGEGSKKKVPPSTDNKQQQQSAKKQENASKKTKNGCNLDLFNNNKKQPSSTSTASTSTASTSTVSTSTSSSTTSIFSCSITSQTKEELLERMAANFDAKTAALDSAFENNDKKLAKKVDSAAAGEKNNLAVTSKTDIVPVKSVSEKREAKNVVSKTENVAVFAKEENEVAANIGGPTKMENVVVDKVEKTECLAVVQALNKVEKVENIVFQTITKDLLGLDHGHKEIKITLPEYFSSKNFQLPKFKQDDGLSVLSEICSALPRFNEPFVVSTVDTASPRVVQLQQPCDSKLPSATNHNNTGGESGFVKYVTTTAAVDDAHTDEQKPPVGSSFESRTVKIVQLARNSSSNGSGDGSDINAVADKKRDLAASWRRAFKNVKVPKNGFLSTGNVSGSSILSNTTWANKNLSSGDRSALPPQKTAADSTTSGPVVLPNMLSDALKKPISEPKNGCSETKTETDKKTAAAASSYLAKATAAKYDLKFEKRGGAGTTATSAITEKSRKDGDLVSSSDDQSPEKKIFHQRRLSTAQSCSGNSSDAFSPDNETSVYAFQPDLPAASTPFRRNKPQSPAKSRTVSPNTSIAVSFENDSAEEKSHQSTSSSLTDVEEGRLFYIPLPAGVQAQPSIQGVTVKLGTEGPQNKLVMSAKLVTKPPASTIPVSSISPKPERKIKPLCTTKITNSTTPVGTVQPTTRTVQPPKCSPSTSKQVLPLPLQINAESKDEKKQRSSQQMAAVTKESKKPSSVSSVASSVEKKPKKTEKQINKRKSSEKVASKKKSFKPNAADMVDAPTFYPSEEDFKDPLQYFEIIKPVAQKYGICKVVPPPSFKPECKVSDDMRFTAYNQYVHKMMDRWGPNVREMMAIKKYLETQSIVLSNPPLIGGMELDLPRLYHTVQELGGLKEVIEMDKWSRVADLMKIPKSAQDRVTKLDDIYCKYLLPYDTLSHEERKKLITDVDKEWKQICKKGDTENEFYEDVHDCITKGRSIALSAYYRVARNSAATWFKDQQQQQGSSGVSGNSSSSSKLAAGSNTIKPEDVESFYWKQVSEKKNHICVLSGSIDSGTEGYGFPTTKTATFTKHPWNLKVLTNNPVSVLKSLGPVMGMTVPTIHMGMVFSACCWYKDPHGLPWIEYLHTGADKVWYGVPGSQSDRFRGAMKRLLPQAVAEGQNQHTWLAADSGMVPPDKLLEHGVTLTRTVQNPGQFLIVMPRAYTCNVSTGYVISESVYFTQRGWMNDAEKIFQDLQRNCEPAAFSFEKLLINMSTDPRTPHNMLKQLLNILSNMRDCEVALRSQLVEDLGLKASERISPTNGSSKSNEPNDDYECDVCHSILYISMVNNSHEDCDYCLRHGIQYLSKKHNQLKYCKFMYTFDENELDSILVKLRERIDSKKKKTSTKS